MKTIALLAAIVGLIVAIGCQQNAGTGATSQPAVIQIDSSAVALLFDTALSDYGDLVAAGVISQDSNVTTAMHAAQDAIDKYNAAPPGTPESQKLLLAANKAVMDFVIAKARVKIANPGATTPVTVPSSR